MDASIQPIGPLQSLPKLFLIGRKSRWVNFAFTPRGPLCFYITI